MKKNEVVSIVRFQLSWVDRLRALFGREVRVRVETSTDAPEIRKASSRSEVSVEPIFRARRRLQTALASALAVALMTLASPALAIGPNGTSGTITAANANLASGTPTASSYVGVALYAGGLANTIFGGSVPQYGVLGVSVTGTFSATLRFQGSTDEGTNWFTVDAYAIPVTGVAAVGTTTTTGRWAVLGAGLTNLRVTASSYTSGTATVVIEGTSPGLAPLINLSDASKRLISGNSDRPTYGVTTTVTVPTSAQSLVAVEASASTKVRLQELKICLTTGLQTTAGERHLVLFHTTAASSGGSAVTPILYDKGDSAFGGAARSGSITTTPAVGSVTVANAIWSEVIFMPAAATTAVPCVTRNFALGQNKPPTIAAGVANGFAIADLTGGAGGTGNYAIDLRFTEESN